MADVNEIPPFPNPGVRLIKEDEHVAIWDVKGHRRGSAQGSK